MQAVVPARVRGCTALKTAQGVAVTLLWCIWGGMRGVFIGESIARKGVGGAVHPDPVVSKLAWNHAQLWVASATARASM